MRRAEQTSCSMYHENLTVPKQLLYFFSQSKHDIGVYHKVQRPSLLFNMLVSAFAHGLLPFQELGFNRWLEIYHGKIPVAVQQVLAESRL